METTRAIAAEKGARLDELGEEIERQREAIGAAELALMLYKGPQLITQEQLTALGWNAGFFAMAGDGYAPAFKALRAALVIAENRYLLASDTFNRLWDSLMARQKQGHWEEA